MSIEILLTFFVVVAIAAYVQTVTGFALGMIIMGAMTWLGLTSITTTAIIVSLLSMANGAIALRIGYRHIDKKAVGLATLGLIPTLITSVFILHYLDNTTSHTLKLLLGATIIYCGVSISLKPKPLEKRSRPLSFLLSGVFGGAFGGSFAISGPPLVYQFYRQPLHIDAIRNSLLCLFAIMHLGRTAFVGLEDKINQETILIALSCLPVVAIATFIGQRFPLPISGLNMRRVAFSLLIVIGVSLVASVISE